MVTYWLKYFYILAGYSYILFEYSYIPTGNCYIPEGIFLQTADK